MLKEFKEFIMRGNAIDMAVGFIICAAFGKVVTSLVSDILMPPLGFIIGKVDFSNLSLTLHEKTADTAAVVISYGAFINTVINLLIVGFAMFIIIKQMNKIMPPKIDPKLKDCSFCMSKISREATRCPNCTSELTADLKKKS
jgi:large conductance mechanosensitive channel